MNKLILLSSSNCDLEYFKQIADELGLEMVWRKVSEKEKIKSDLFQKKGNFLIIDLKCFECLDLLGRSEFEPGRNKIYGYTDSQKKKNVEEYDSHLFDAFIDIHLQPSFYLPLFKQKIQQEIYSENINDIIQIGKDLNRIVSLNLSELSRIKRLHEKIVPIRNESVKRLGVFSKFAAGEGAGGEFFDVLKSDTEVVLFLTSATSYITSSIVLGLFEKYKQRGKHSKDELESLVVQMFNEIHGLEMDEPRDIQHFQLFIAYIDLKKMHVNGYNFGRTQFLSTKEIFTEDNKYPVDPSFLEKAALNTKLKRGEQYLVISPGLRRNTRDYLDDKSTLQFFDHIKNEKPKAILNEIFYQLKKDSHGQFLKNDATAIYLEVDSNALVQM